MAPPMNTPARPAISSPPRHASICSAYSGLSVPASSSGRYLSSASLITCIFFLKPAVLRPAPLPVTSLTSRPRSAAARAELVVVLPMPISPVARSLYPLMLQSQTMSMPVSIACMHSSSFMAGSTAKSLVPFMILRLITPFGLPSMFMPISTGMVSALAVLAILQTELSPLPIHSATAAVTSCPDWLTPSATTPLSAIIMMTARFFISILSESWMAPMRAVMSSNLPRLPSGLATLSHLSFISSYLSLLNGSMLIKTQPPSALNI